MWSADVSAPPLFPPVHAAGRIVVASRSGVVQAFHADRGMLAWSVVFESVQPLEAGGEVVFAAGSTGITALDASDGEPRWQAPLGPASAPLLYRDGWLIGASAEETFALRAGDGAVVWRRRLGDQRERAAIEGNALFVPLQDGRLVAVALQTGAPIWERQLAGPPAEPLAFADRVYAGGLDKFFYALDARSGRILWRWRVGAAVRGRPAADTERVYFAALDNLLRALDRGSGVLRWHTPLPYRPDGGPSLAGGHVLVAGGADRIKAFDPATGRSAGEIGLRAPLGTPPAYLEDGRGGFRLAAVTGTLGAEWRLTLLEPAPPEIGVEPLTTLPGQVVPAPERSTTSARP